MNRLLVLAAAIATVACAALSTTSCLRDDIQNCPSTVPVPTPPDPDDTDPLDRALYHEGVEAWIVPQKDPYSLDNFRQALADLASAGVVPFTRAGDLEATHYALRIFPRNEEEQWEVELMEDVRVAYIPFDYIALTEEQAGELETGSTAGADGIPLFTDRSPYSTDYSDARTVEGVTEDISYAMPILYAVWPVKKPLPANLDYELDYKVYLPAAASQQTRGGKSGPQPFDAETLRVLEREAIRLALGRCSSRPEAVTRAAETALTGEFWMWEVLKPVRVPIPKIKVSFNLGSNIVETEADDNGYFTVPSSSVPADATWAIMFQDSKWRVTRENSSIPKTFYHGGVFQEVYWSEENSHVRVTIQPYYATIINMLHYFYYATHNITKWTDTNGIHVIAHSDGSKSYDGLFTSTSGGTNYITIFRNNTSDDRNLLAGTLLHELGHFVQYKERGSATKFNQVDRLLKESFAAWVGWYLTDKYYAELGYVRNLSEDVSGQAEQLWMKNKKGESGYYSPLFVDLTDNFDQSSYYGGDYNPDKLKGVHYSVIMRIAKEATDWESCKKILREDSGLSTADLDAFIAPYDYWYSQQ